MTPDQASKIVEAVRDLARSGFEEPMTPRDWARELLEGLGLNWYPVEPLKLDQEPASFPGIELRVRLLTATVLQADSVMLHMIAKYAGCSPEDWYDPFTPRPNPFAATAQWVDGKGWEKRTLPIEIQMRPRMLWLPADPESEEDPE